MGTTGELDLPGLGRWCRRLEMGWGGRARGLSFSGMTDSSDSEVGRVAQPRYIAGSEAVQALVDRIAGTGDRLGGAIRDVEDVRCSVASKNEDVVVEVSGLQKLTGLYLEPGLYRRYSPDQLAAEISETVLAGAEVAGEKVREARARYFLPDSDDEG